MPASRWSPLISFPRVDEFRDVTVTAEGILIRDDQIMVESFAREENFRRFTRKRSFKRYGQTVLQRPLRKIDSAVWVTDDWSKGYYHWLADVLPKLVIASNRIKDSTVLLPARLRDSNLVKESFSLFDVKNYEFINENETIIANRLYLPSHTADSGSFDEVVINEVRRKLIGILSISTPNKRIYISRSPAKRRKVVNEPEVSRLLAEFGFETVVAEELSFPEQIRLFTSASHIVSIHGAGLANMLFMPTGGRILELRKNGDRAENCFANLACALCYEFDYLTCPAVNDADAPYIADLVVDTQSLREQLGLFLQRL